MPGERNDADQRRNGSTAAAICNAKAPGRAGRLFANPGKPSNSSFARQTVAPEVTP